MCHQSTPAPPMCWMGIKHRRTASYMRVFPIPLRGRTQQQDQKVQCYEPATVKYLGYFPALSPTEHRVAQARKAQKVCAKSSFKQRRQFLRILLKISSRDTGRTMVDISLGEIMTTCEKITWLLSEGEQWLKPEHRFQNKEVGLGVSASD
ncbi:aldehyde dehydrogenase 22A1 isoform X2 [Hevea brasiliensis]|uniref:aldehyde dehydrogenase 22A1 isoform X2 n=1 Tax=Hevea brasiliensis TaxID=3981 RepID=UPI0025FA8095|nr:aldehyde dehydrogenase 22A1 isoform X2 [Hevea brasiliensis]